MQKRHVAAAFILMLCLMTACAQKSDGEERSDVLTAGDASEDMGRRESGGSEELPAGAGSEAEESGMGDGQAGSPNLSAEKNVSELLKSYAGTRIQQTVEAADGSTLYIDAEVNVDGITGVSRYEYILEDVTEKVRADLFRAVFAEAADRAEYDERNDVWTLDIDPARRNYFLYLISYSNGGAAISGEQIMVLQNRYYDLYPFEDNRLDSVSDSAVGLTPEEAESLCGQVVSSITDSGEYAMSHVLAYGTNGRRPYLKVVFQRMLDGMPVTSYNDLSFLIDEDGMEEVKGSLFSVREIGLEGALLTPQEAVLKLQEQAALLNLEGETRTTVSEIAMEYVVVQSQNGEVTVAPVWRFLLGGDAEERNLLRQKILGVDAVTGEILWEERGNTQ